MSSVPTPSRFLLRGTLSAWIACVVAAAFSLVPVFCLADDVADKGTNEKPQLIKADKDGWRPLTTLWTEAHFGGDGDVTFGKDAVHLASGDPLTGIRWTGKLPTENYELRLEGRRVDGFDFFCAVTFPVAKEHCSFVMGGWGGGIVGISSIDGNDASSNETTQFKDFKNGTWYKVRIRVDDKQIRCWIDDEDWATVDRENHQFDIRIEMDPCLPLGIANFQCESEIRNIAIRELKSSAKGKSGNAEVKTTDSKSDTSK